MWTQANEMIKTLININSTNEISDFESRLLLRNSH